MNGKKKERRIKPSLVATTSAFARTTFVRTHYVRTNFSRLKVEDSAKIKCNINMGDVAGLGCMFWISLADYPGNPWLYVLDIPGCISWISIAVCPGYPWLYVLDIPGCISWISLAVCPGYPRYCWHSSLHQQAITNAVMVIFIVRKRKGK